jgi:alpha-N-arabinofuranosidase
LQINSGGTALSGQDKIYASSVWDNNTNEVILKIVNSSDKDQVKEIVLEGRGKINPKATLIVLKSDSLDAVNSLDEPKNISPVEQSMTLKGKKFSLTLPSSSLSVVRIKYSK